MYLELWRPLRRTDVICATAIDHGIHFGPVVSALCYHQFVPDLIPANVTLVMNTVRRTQIQQLSPTTQMATAKPQHVALKARNERPKTCDKNVLQPPAYSLVGGVMWRPQKITDIIGAMATDHGARFDLVVGGHCYHQFISRSISAAATRFPTEPAFVS